MTSWEGCYSLPFFSFQCCRLGRLLNLVLLAALEALSGLDAFSQLDAR